MNCCLVELIESGIIGDTTGKPREYNDLDHLFGSLSVADAKCIASAVADSRTVDEELWS